MSTQKTFKRGLEPIAHQVAGQSLMLKFDSSTLCKSLIEREHRFYKALPPDLVSFVPQCRGKTQLYLPDPDSHDCPASCECSRPHHHLPTTNTGAPVAWIDSQLVSLAGVEEPSRKLKVLEKSNKSRHGLGHIYDFILLEDIVSKFEKPCVLDLKMGTRQHGDDAPLEKVVLQEKKCRMTTSSSLGLRLCGMKRYNVSTQEYETIDKFQGRAMSDYDVKTALKSFLHNGDNYWLHLAQQIVQRLQKLRKIVESLDTYRFFACSLLLVYEGKNNFIKKNSVKCARTSEVENEKRETSQTTNSNTSLQVSDGRTLSMSGEQSKINSNAKYSTKSSKNENNHQENQSIKTNKLNNNYENSVDEGVSLNNGTLDCKTEPFHNGELDSETEHFNNEELDSETEHFNNGTLDSETEHLNNGTLDCEREHFNKNNTVIKIKRKNSEFLPTFDMRIVDFAQTTFQGFGKDSIVHEGPDRGFLKGIDTLLSVFNSLLAQHSLQ